MTRAFSLPVKGASAPAVSAGCVLQVSWPPRPVLKKLTLLAAHAQQTTFPPEPEVTARHARCVPLARTRLERAPQNGTRCASLAPAAISPSPPGRHAGAAGSALQGSLKAGSALLDTTLSASLAACALRVIRSPAPARDSQTLCVSCVPLVPSRREGAPAVARAPRAILVKRWSRTARRGVTRSACHVRRASSSATPLACVSDAADVAQAPCCRRHRAAALKTRLARPARLEPSPAPTGGAASHAPLVFLESASVASARRPKTRNVNGAREVTSSQRTTERAAPVRAAQRAQRPSAPARAKKTRPVTHAQRATTRRVQVSLVASARCAHRAPTWPAPAPGSPTPSATRAPRAPTWPRGPRALPPVSSAASVEHRRSCWLLAGRTLMSGVEAAGKVSLSLLQLFFSVSSGSPSRL